MACIRRQILNLRSWRSLHWVPELLEGSLGALFADVKDAITQEGVTNETKHLFEVRH